MAGNLRPGVYSRYEVSSFYTAASAARRAALVVAAESGEAGEAYLLRTLSEAAERFPAAGDGKMLAAAGILLRGGVAVYALPVREGEYAAALEAAARLEDVGAVVCGGTGLEELRLLKKTAVQASEAMRERVAFAGLDGDGEALDAARELDSERVCLCCPAAKAKDGGEEADALYTAAAVAAEVLRADDPAWNFNGLEMEQLTSPRQLEEEAVQALLAGGVTVVEEVGGKAEIVRALTTRGVSDRGLGPLNTILIIDDVVTGVREGLKARLRGRRIGSGWMESVTAQVLVELAAKRDGGIIESFEAPVVYADKDDPTVCVVELGFKVAHVVSQIHVSTHVQV